MNATVITTGPGVIIETATASRNWRSVSQWNRSTTPPWRNGTIASPLPKTNNPADPHRETEQRRDRRGEDNPRCVSRHAVHRRANSLFPQRTHELFVSAGRRFFVGHHIQEKSDRSHVERDQHESPFHHRRLWVISQLVVCDVRGGHHGGQQPRIYHKVDGLEDHGGLEVNDPWAAWESPCRAGHGLGECGGTAFRPRACATRRSDRVMLARRSAIPEILGRPSPSRSGQPRECTPLKTPQR